MRVLQITCRKRLIWLEKASRPDPYWFYRDKSGNGHRTYLAWEKVSDRRSSAEAISIIAGRWKLTMAVVRSA